MHTCKLLDRKFGSGANVPENKDIIPENEVGFQKFSALRKRGQIRGIFFHGKIPERGVNWYFIKENDTPVQHFTKCM